MEERVHRKVGHGLGGLGIREQGVKESECGEREVAQKGRTTDDRD